MKQSFQNFKVLEFYNKLPFNIYSNPKEAIRNIKNNNPVNSYPILNDIIIDKRDFNILDVGCGAGWFANSLSFFYRNIKVIGIDYNQIALDFANSIRDEMALKTSFLKQDLFDLNINTRIDLIASIGVLHHTNNCIEAIDRILELSPEYFLLGLYHKHGRRPFLDHFDQLKQKYKNLGTAEKEKLLFEEYKKLDKRKMEDLHLESWFKDQVLHPHETQHTFEEIIPVFVNKGYTIVNTSLNKFQPIKNYKSIIETENTWYEYGLRKLVKNEYFPGLFVIIATNKPKEVLK